MPNGVVVAVKVRRPGLEKLITDDIATLRHLAAVLESLFPKLLELGLTSMVGEFERSLRREVDFMREARNICRFRRSLTQFRGVWIPAVIESRSSEAVLTMKYSPGIRIDSYAKKHRGGARRQISALVGVMLKTIFEDGIFHADPHPGNVFVLPDGRLSLIDFGMVGELDGPMRQSLKCLLKAIVEGDSAGATNSYIEMAESNVQANRPALRADIRAILQDFHGRGLKELSFGNTLAALLRAGTKNGVQSSVAFFLLTRVFVILESEIHTLDPDFNFVASLAKEIKRLHAKHFSLPQLMREGGSAAAEIERFVGDAPGDARRILKQMADGNLGSIHAPELESLALRVNREIQQLTVAIAAAALTVGGSMLGATPQMGWRSIMGDATFFCGLAIIVFIGFRSISHFLARRFAAWGPGRDKAEPPMA
jgi:ubiquinone biosynthesis protein